MTRFGLIWLHDADGRPAPPEVEVFACDEGAICVNPVTPSALWLGQPIDPDTGYSPLGRVAELVRKLIADYSLSPHRLAVWGVGLGGQGALQLGFRYPDLFPVVMAVNPLLDLHDYYGLGTPLDELYSGREQCRNDTATAWVPDKYRPASLCIWTDPADMPRRFGAERLAEKLGSRGVAADFGDCPGDDNSSRFDNIFPDLASRTRQAWADGARRLI